MFTHGPLLCLLDRLIPKSKPIAQALEISNTALLLEIPSAFHFLKVPNPTEVSFVFIPQLPPLTASSSSGHMFFLFPLTSIRSSNSRAFKVAGLTTLACLLLASQVFTAYMVFGQKQQINSLQRDSDKMAKRLTRARPKVKDVIK